MNLIISFNGDTIAGLENLGISELHADVNDRGMVIRELGISADSTIVHRHPGAPSVARHGLFDNQIIDTAGTPSNVTWYQFEALWTGAA